MWVLIVVISFKAGYAGGLATVTQEVSSKQACYSAGELVKKQQQGVGHVDYVNWSCIRK